MDRLFSESCTSCSTLRSISCSVKFMWKRLRRFCTVPEQPFLKQGKWASIKGVDKQLQICLYRYIFYVLLTAAHDFHKVYNAIHVLACRHHADKQKAIEFSPMFGPGAAHNIDKFMCELERWLLETCKGRRERLLLIT